ncbi:MAG: OpgD/OpgG family glucan biosynthesis protein [Thermoguttaceae bacterium]
MKNAFQKPQTIVGALAISLSSLLLAMAGDVTPAVPPCGDHDRWDFAALRQCAEKLAAGPFVAAGELPQVLQDLDYDTYRLIAFRHEKAIWKQERLPFWLEAFHRGYLHRDRVTLNLVEDGEVKPVPFDPAYFQYRGELSGLKVPPDAGFAGFRILGWFESSEHPLEIASFLGASYYRAIGEGQWYGTSARGLAVDVGLPKPEEFPVFRQFWLQRPRPGERQLTVLALLDSPSVTGAYRFVLQPGAATRWHVTTRLHFRRQPEKVGLAPLTSMWMWGDGRAGPAGDPRPEVHDADGLLVATSEGEWIWRPLSRQGYPSLTHNDFTGIRGFGLLQRDRRRERYQDDEARYHLRPSVWIEPRDGWPKGAVELLELPASHEGIDNIAAWWTPAEAVTVGKPLDLDYSVSFMSAEPEGHPAARTTATRVERHEGKPVRVEVEFSGEPLRDIADDSVEPKVQCQRGETENVHVQRAADELWLLSFDVHPKGAEPMELSAVLEFRGRALTETWRYLCPNSQE